MINCFLCQISHTWELEDQNLIQFVSPERQKKISKYLYVSDKKLCLYAGLLARWGLSSVTGQPLNNLAFLYEQCSKPLFLSNLKYDFSLSHTDQFILCCISSDTHVGADISKIEKAPFEIMNLTFHHKEIEYIKSASPSKQSTLFYKIWTQKEAYTKYLGTGLVYDTTNCNILDPCYSDLLYVWVQNKYMCCICGKNASSHNIVNLSEAHLKSKFGV